MKSRTTNALSMLALCLLLTGCTPTLRTPANDPSFTGHPMTRVPAPVPTCYPDMTLEKAKAMSLAMQDELVAFVPSEWIAERDTKETSHLGPCRPNNYFSWNGRTRLTLNAPHDYQDIIENIARHYEAGAEFVARRSTKPSGQPRVDLVGTDGSGYLVTRESKDLTDIVIMADSPCFRLPDGLSPRRDY
jgi:hypothetical protein